MGPKDKSKVYNTNLLEFIEFKNMLELSEIVLTCAIKRQESRGAHFRSDFKLQNDELYKVHSIVYKEAAVYGVKYED
jgi:succinate dehydrogenase / fumarate reductase flavoprotein subunit